MRIHRSYRTARLQLPSEREQEHASRTSRAPAERKTHTERQKVQLRPRFLLLLAKNRVTDPLCVPSKLCGKRGKHLTNNPSPCLSCVQKRSATRQTNIVRKQRSVITNATTPDTTTLPSISFVELRQLPTYCNLTARGQGTRTAKGHCVVLRTSSLHVCTSVRYVWLSHVMKGHGHVMHDLCGVFHVWVDVSVPRQNVHNYFAEFNM